MILTLLVDRCGHRRRLEITRLEGEILVPYLPRRSLGFDLLSADPVATISFHSVPFRACDYGRYYGEQWVRPPDVPADACVFGIERALVTAEEWRDARMGVMPFERAQYLAYRKNMGPPPNGGALHISPALDGAVWIEAWPNDERLIAPEDEPLTARRVLVLSSLAGVLDAMAARDILPPPRQPELPDTPVSLSPSDGGISGARPLPPDDLPSREIVDLPWHEINRKFNALFRGA